MFEYLLVKALFTIFLISLIVLISVIWTKIEKIMDETVFKNVSENQICINYDNCYGGRICSHSHYFIKLESFNY